MEQNKGALFDKKKGADSINLKVIYVSYSNAHQEDQSNVKKIWLR